MTIKMQMWRPDTCGCVLMQKWDTDHPEREPEYVTGEEYLAFIKSIKDQPNVFNEDDAIKMAAQIRICGEHQAHGHTKKLHDEVLKKNRDENAKKNAAIESQKKAEADAKHAEIEQVVRNILAEKK